MSGKPEESESVYDVLREWRDMVCYHDGPVHPLNHGAVMRNLDRIEAALKRERELIISEKEHFRLYGLSEHEKVLQLKALQTGNAAKLREVVKCLMDNLNIHLVQPSEQITVNRAELDGMVMVCEKALAAPPRNCDRFKTKEEAATAFANEKKQWIPQQVLWELAPWLDWLFAPANESEVRQ